MLTEKTKYDKENCLHVIEQNNEPRSLRLAPDYFVLMSDPNKS